MHENLSVASFSSNAGGSGSSGGAPTRDTRGMLLIATAATVALMFIPGSNYLLYPLRLFVTFIHESGHALAAVISGGSVDHLTVFANGEGVTWTADSPFWRWLTISGGYLGAALFGALLLQVAKISTWKNAGRAALYGMAGYILAVTLLWAHNPITNGFTWIAGLALAALLWALARYTTPRGADFVASFLAVQCSLNALTDLRILLTITHNNLGDSDAKFMTDAYGLFPTFWAVCWAVMAVAIVGASLWSYIRAASGRPVRSMRQKSLPTL